MKLSITQFAGMAPIIPNNLLPNNNASECLNARREGVSIVPIREMLSSGFAAANTVNSWSLYPFDKTKTLTRTDDADFIRGPIANDEWDRVYIAGDSLAPQVAYKSGGSVNLVTLGINPPPTPTIPTDWNTKVPSDSTITVVRAIYYVTAVTALGEESEPSDVTQVINRWDLANVPITLGASNDSRAAKRRIYRSEAGGEYNLVVELPASTNSYTDSVYSDNLGYVCESEEFNAPPSNLGGLTLVANGFIAGFFENTVCFCEPYYPHAWPIDYQYALPATITGIVVVAGAVIVTTEGNPWMFSGSHPSAMTQTRLDIRAGNLSRRGLVDLGDFALYPTQEGLMMIGSGGANIVTKQFLSRDQWLALEPSTFKAFRYRGTYLCFGNAGSFIFDLETGYWPITISDVSTDRVINGHYDDEQDTLYLLIKHADDSRSVMTFDSGDKRSMVWKSREFILTPSAVFSAARVDAEAAVDFSLLGDDWYSFAKSVTNDNGFRLPAGKPKRLSVSLTSSDQVNVVTLASSKSEVL